MSVQSLQSHIPTVVSQFSALWSFIHLISSSQSVNNPLWLIVYVFLPIKIDPKWRHRSESAPSAMGI